MELPSELHRARDGGGGTGTCSTSSCSCMAFRKRKSFVSEEVGISMKRNGTSNSRFMVGLFVCCLFQLAG